MNTIYKLGKRKKKMAEKFSLVKDEDIKIKTQHKTT